MAYVVGLVSISLLIGPYIVSLFGNSSSRPGEAIAGFAARSPWTLIQLAVFPLAAAGLLAYVVVRSVEGLGGWSGRDLVSLYVMLGTGAAIMLYVRLRGGSDYFNLPRETYQPQAKPAVAAGGDSKGP